MSRMTLSDRIEIEAGIYARKSLSEIAEQIHKSRRYVSEELRRNATKIPGEHPLGKRCRNATGCRRGGLCGKENCHQMCYTCKEVDCQTVCKAYNDNPCKELQKPPYVCNVCSRRRKCKSDRVILHRTASRCCGKAPVRRGQKQATDAKGSDSSSGCSGNTAH